MFSVTRKRKRKKKDKHVKEFCESVNLEDCIRETVNMFSVTRKKFGEKVAIGAMYSEFKCRRVF